MFLPMTLLGEVGEIVIQITSYFFTRLETSLRTESIITFILI